MARLNNQEVTVLMGIHQRLSLSEMAERIDRSVTQAWKVANELERMGLATQTKPHGARTRLLTPQGVAYLQSEGLLK